MAITNYTGAALEQQSAILDQRAAQSTMLNGGLMGKSLDASLLPSQAVFGEGGMALGGAGGGDLGIGLSPESAALLTPNDGTIMGDEASGLGDQLEEMMDQLMPDTSLQALQDQFRRPV